MAKSKKKTGPPKKPADQKFSHKFTVKMTKRAREKLSGLARAAGHPDAAEYIRHLATIEHRKHFKRPFDFNTGDYAPAPKIASPAAMSAPVAPAPAEPAAPMATDAEIEQAAATARAVAEIAPEVPPEATVGDGSPAGAAPQEGNC